MLKVNAKSGEIFIYDVIGQDWFGGGITAVSVIEALDELKGKPAHVRINSPGGVADEGIAIYNALKRYEGGVTTYVDALAASAASIVALAGQTRNTSRGARWMIHRAIGGAMGNAADMNKMADMLARYDQSIIEIYSQYMDKPADEIESMMDAETWFSADESVAAGLSTAIDGEATEQPVGASWIRKPPESFFNTRVESKMEPRRGRWIASKLTARA